MTDQPKTNNLFLGDNLKILQEQISEKSVNLVYLDPPFGSNRNYHLDSSPKTKQKKVFSDTWKWDDKTTAEIAEFMTVAPALGKLVESIIGSIGISPVTTYLVMMVPRLLEIHRVMNDTGSLYLHCDPTASHYLKIVLDCIFGESNFRNEIAWTYKGGGRSKNAFARKHDIILYYTKSDERVFNYRDIMVDRTNRTWFTDDNGERYWLKYGKRYYLQHDGKVPEDWWADIDPLHGPYKERLGYPTQKPLALLERIILASSNEHDIILDPFCGSGTTLVAAQKLNRRWIGIDSSDQAIEMVDRRLKNEFPDAEYLEG
jgi:site-specific DNA-methyltransferase (adenine-specific)